MGVAVVVSDLPLIMLYPLLKWDTSFPAGFTGETVDLLLKDASSRTLRARTEAPARNFRHHEILETELDHLQPRTWVAERQRIDDSRRARGFSVNKFGINRPDREIDTTRVRQNLDLLFSLADPHLFWKEQ